MPQENDSNGSLDLFRERIKTHPLSMYIDGISEEDGRDFDKAVEFIRSKFYEVLPKTMKMRSYVILDTKLLTT